jgi:hypothetical protein
MSPETTGDRHRSRYAALGRYLAAQSGARVALTLEQVEALVGGPLPASAGGRGWWCNYGRARPHARSWLDAGWRVEEIRLRERLVAFVPAGVPRHPPRSQPTGRSGRTCAPRPTTRSP